MKLAEKPLENISEGFFLYFLTKNIKLTKPNTVHDHANRSFSVACRGILDGLLNHKNVSSRVRLALEGKLNEKKKIFSLR